MELLSAPFLKEASLLDALAPDIAVLQEWTDQFPAHCSLVKGPLLPSGRIRAIELHRNLFTRYRTVLVGDLNSSAAEPHGQEKRYTSYFRWKEQKPYHIDYCFISKEWAPDIQRFKIGSYAEWREKSDHRPLLVEVADQANRHG